MTAKDRHDELVALLTQIRDRLPEPEGDDLIDDATDARYEREDAEARQDDPDTVTLRRDDVEVLFSHRTVAPPQRAEAAYRVRAALGWGEQR